MVLLRGVDPKGEKIYSIFGLDKNDIGKLLSGQTGRFKGTDIHKDINYIFFYEDDEQKILDRITNENPNIIIDE